MSGICILRYPPALFVPQPCIETLRWARLAWPRLRCSHTLVPWAEGAELQDGNLCPMSSLSWLFRFKSWLVVSCS